MFSAFSNLNRGQILFLLIWPFVILTISISAGNSIIHMERGVLEKSIRDHKARVDPNLTEDGKTQPESKPPAEHEGEIPADVIVGVYVDRISALSMKESYWTVDFYIWFTWKDDNLNPGETFQVVGGEIVKPTPTLIEKKDVNGEHYALYRVIAKITKTFNTTRFPRDDHLLTIHIEDNERPFYQLHYIADEANSNYSSRVNVPGYKVYQQTAVVKPHSYKTNRGDPELPEGYKATYSQFIYGIWIERPGWGLHIKMFLTLFAAVLIPAIGFFTNPTHRLQVVVGSFFASVASTYISSTVVPDPGIVTLADIINGIGVLTIALILFQTIISQYFYEKQKREDFSDAFDYVTFVVLIGLFIWLNIAIPTAATLTPQLFASISP